MMEELTNHCWQMPYAHSPSGSVDSGVELSPTRTCIPYGHYDDCYGHICGDVNGPESPAYSSGSSQVGDGNLACPASLTQEELDTLSDTLSDVLSPCSDDQQSPVADLTEIGQYGFQQQRPAESLTELFDSASGETSINTTKRKRSQKARHIGLCESNPGVDPCLVPKSGTAKPRQSRRRKEPTKPMAGGQGTVRMNRNKCYTGARVKETARELLQKIRQKRQRNEGAVESGSRMASQGIMHQPPAKRGRVGLEDIGTSCSNIYPVTQPQGSALQGTRPQITHSVQQILSPSQAFHGDALDSVLEEAIERNNTVPFETYAERAQMSYSGSGQTAFQHVLKRLIESKERYPDHKIKNVTALLCQIFPRSLNQQNYQGETPIYQAALYGNVGAVTALMEHGADPWIKENSAGETALHAAVKSKKLAVVEAILQGSQNRHPQFATGINIAACDGNTPLHKAAALRNVDVELQSRIVTALLSSDADPSIKNNQSQMAHYFLPEPLKELQARMKRHSGRRNRSIQHPSAPVHGEQYVHCNVPEFPPPYTYHVGPDVMPHSLPQRQQYSYETIPQPVQTFPVTTQPPMTQYEHYQPQNAPLYYSDPRALAVIPNQGNPECSGAEFEDIFDSFSA